jgi:restriction system protein
MYFLFDFNYLHIDYIWGTIFAALGITLIILIILIVRDKWIDAKELKESQEQLSQSRITDIDRMDGSEFEYYLVVLFEKIGIPATQTPLSGDYGADLILEGNERVVIQAKRYQSKVGIKAVQEINSAKNYYMAQEGWVITNNYFTEPAKKLAESTCVKLIDRDELVDLILNANNTSLDKEVY